MTKRQHIPAKKQKAPKSVFLAATIMLFFCTLSVADSVGFVPDYIDGTTPTPSATSVSADSVALSSLPQLGVTNTSSATSTQTNTGTGILPVRLIIPAINLDLPVQNPDTRDVDTLDNLLKSGPARYVDSAQLGVAGNMLIFAHSSHLPIVHNKMFQAFNGIPNLKAGDTITVVGADKKNYLYSVTSVTKADVSDTTISLSPTDGTKLTLVTCDTLTGKSARFVLEADFVGVVGTSSGQ